PGCRTCRARPAAGRERLRVDSPPARAGNTAPDRLRQAGANETHRSADQHGPRRRHRRGCAGRGAPPEADRRRGTGLVRGDRRVRAAGHKRESPAVDPRQRDPDSALRRQFGGIHARLEAPRGAQRGGSALGAVAAVGGEPGRAATLPARPRLREISALSESAFGDDRSVKLIRSSAAGSSAVVYLRGGNTMSHDDKELYQALESVRDEETFLQFLLALRDDREASIAQEAATPSSPYG